MNGFLRASSDSKSFDEQHRARARVRETSPVQEKGRVMIIPTKSLWRQLSIVGLLWTLGSCSHGATGSPDPVDDDPGSIVGDLAVYVATFENGTSETRYFLRDGAGGERKLVFAEEPDVAPGTRLKVWGIVEGDGLRVAKFAAASEASTGNVGRQAEPLIGVPPAAPRILCPVVVNVGGGGSLTVDKAETQFHVGPTSVNAYYLENSYGKNSVGGKTYGPFTYNMASCDTMGLADTLRQMVPASDGCDQYAWVMTPMVASCAWAGLGELGTADKPAQDTWYNNSISCVVAVQEPGHNYGAQHSSAITCSGVGITDSLASCQHSEYGDKFDTMGGGCRHFNAWQKLYQKWWGGCNAVKVGSSGTFNLYPTEIPCNGVQALQIPFPGGKTRPFSSSGGGGPATTTNLTSWYLEYRTSTGFDQGMTPQVLVHVGAAPVLPTQSNPKGQHTWIVNASGSSTNPGLTAGKSISDPAGGLTMTVMSMDATKAVIQVDYQGGSGDTVCLDGMNTPFTAPGPDDCSTVPTPTDGGMAGSGGRDAGSADAARDAAGGTAGRDAGVDAGGGGQAGGAGSGFAGSSGGPTGPGGNGPSGSGGSGRAGAGGQMGTGGAGGAGAVDGGDAGSSTTGRRRGAPADDTGACSCRIGSQASPFGSFQAWAALLAMVTWSRIRRARVSRRPRVPLP
jgi:hypothetical protein